MEHEPDNAPPTTRYTRLRQRRLLRARRLQAFGGYALACSFILPAATSCNDVVVPAKTVLGTIVNEHSGLTDPADWAWLFLAFVAAYLYGLITVVIAIRAGKPTSGGRKERGACVAALLSACVAALAIMMVDGVPNVARLSWHGVMFIAIEVVSLAYLIRGLRDGAGGLLAIRWYMAVCCVAWFGTIPTWGEPLFGIWISLAGSILIAVGCFLEAMVRSWRGGFSTLGSLLLARVTALDHNRRRCLFCGYSLIGLITPRCPECGNAFDWKEHGLVPGKRLPAVIPFDDGDASAKMKPSGHHLQNVDTHESRTE